MERIIPKFTSFEEIETKGRMSELLCIIEEKERKVMRSALLKLEGKATEIDLVYFNKYTSEIADARIEYETLKRRINE